MARASSRSTQGQYMTEEVTTASSDPMLKAMGIGILAIVVLILTVLLYGLIAGVINPAAPRTAVEFALERAETAIKNPKADGRDWADAIALLYSSGKKQEAYDTVEKGRVALKGNNEAVYIDEAYVQLLINDNKNKEAAKAAEKAFATQMKIREKIAKDSASKGLSVPPQLKRDQNLLTIDLLVLWATAEANLKHYPKANEILAQAIVLDTTASDVITMRGDIFLKQKMYGEAKKHYVEALKYLPDYQPAIQGLKSVAAAEKKSGSQPATDSK